MRGCMLFTITGFLFVIYWHYLDNKKSLKILSELSNNVIHLNNLSNKKVIYLSLHSGTIGNYLVYLIILD